MKMSLVIALVIIGARAGLDGYHYVMGMLLALAINITWHHFEGSR